MPRGGIPDRWMSYSKIGSVIGGTPFIAFKVPLKEALSQNVEPEERFSPSNLMQQCPNLGLVVDLTNTTRYYGPAEFLARGVKHCKIMCPGHGSVPKDEEVQRFAEVVDSFLEERTSEEKLVGVHCTHGLNRTGYMICRYMIDRMGFSPVKAIKAFDDARGHPIERTEYLEALCCTGARLSDRPQKKEKSDRRSRKTQPSSGGYQEQRCYDSQPQKSWNKDYRYHNSSSYGWQRESERLGDPYQYDGRFGNEGLPRDNSRQVTSSDYRQSSPYSQNRSPSGYNRSNSSSYRGQRQQSTSQQSNSNDYLGHRQQASYSGYNQSNSNGYRGPRQQAAAYSGYNQSHSNDYRGEKQQEHQRHHDYRRPIQNSGVFYDQASRGGSSRLNKKTYFPDDSEQEVTSAAKPSCWF